MSSTEPSIVFSKFRNRLNKENRPRRISDFIDKLDLKFPSSKLRSILMANPFYPHPPPEAWMNATPAEFNAAGLAYPSQPDMAALDSTRVGTRRAFTEAEHGDFRANRRRVDENLYAGVDLTQDMQDPSTYHSGTGIYSNPHHALSTYTSTDHSMTFPGSKYDIFTPPAPTGLGAQVHQPAPPPPTHMNTSPGAQASSSASSWNASNMPPAPPIPTATRPAGAPAPAAGGAHNRLLATLITGPASSTTHARTTSMGASLFSFAPRSGTSTTTGPSSVQPYLANESQPCPSSISRTSYASSSNVSGHVVPSQSSSAPQSSRQGNAGGFVLPPPGPRPSSPTGSQLLRSPGLGATFNPRNSPPRYAVHRPAITEPQGPPPANNNVAPAVPEVGNNEDEDMADPGAESNDEINPMDHLWDEHHLKHLYPLGPQSISADLRDMFLATKRAGKTWLFWEKSFVVEDYFGIMTPERKARVEDVLGPPKLGRYPLSCQDISERLFNGRRSGTAVWGVLHNIAATWVGLKKFHIRFKVAWDYLLPDHVLFPQIQDKLDEFAVQDDSLGNLTPAEYVTWMCDSKRGWSALLQYHLHDHATYGARMFQSGRHSPPPGRIGASSSTRSARRTSHVSALGGSWASKGKGRVDSEPNNAGSVTNNEGVESIPSPPPSTVESGSQNTPSVPRTIARMPATPRSGNRVMHRTRSIAETRLTSASASGKTGNIIKIWGLKLGKFRQINSI